MGYFDRVTTNEDGRLFLPDVRPQAISGWPDADDREAYDLGDQEDDYERAQSLWEAVTEYGSETFAPTHYDWTD